MAEEMIRPDMEEDLTITLSLEDGDIECEVITTLEAGENSYIVVTPVDGMYRGEEVDYWIYRYHVEDDEPVLESIMSDQEYEDVMDAYEEFLDTLDFEALLGSDEE